MLDVMLGRFGSVMRRVMKMTLRGVRMVRRRLVITFFVVSCRFAVMARRVFVVFRCFVMMLCRLFRHRSSSFVAQPDSPARGRVLLRWLTNRQRIVNGRIPRVRKSMSCVKPAVNVHEREATASTIDFKFWWVLDSA